MLKRISNLLFEDDDDEFEEEEETSESPVITPAPAPKPQPVYTQPAPAPKVEEPIRLPEPEPEVKPAPSPAPAPKPAASDQPRTTMQRIDVTANIPVEPVRNPAPRNESVFKEPAPAPKPQPAPKSQPAAKPQQQPMTRTQQTAQRTASISSETKPLGIKADGAQPAKQRSVTSKPKKERPAYQFQPVISPIFGVDEKDMNALKTTTSRFNATTSQKKTSVNTTPIISPMYGRNTEETITAPKPQIPAEPVVVEEKKPIVEAVAEKAPVVEDDIPEFSLDDILSSNDAEFAQENRKPENSDSLNFPDLTFPDMDEDTDGLVFKRD